jgi:hypothetical protein
LVIWPGLETWIGPGAFWARCAAAALTGGFTRGLAAFAEIFAGIFAGFFGRRGKVFGFLSVTRRPAVAFRVARPDLAARCVGAVRPGAPGKRRSSSTVTTGKGIGASRPIINTPAIAPCAARDAITKPPNQMPRRDADARGA